MAEIEVDDEGLQTPYASQHASPSGYSDAFPEDTFQMRTAELEAELEILQTKLFFNKAITRLCDYQAREQVKKLETTLQRTISQLKEAEQARAIAVEQWEEMVRRLLTTQSQDTHDEQEVAQAAADGAAADNFVEGTVFNNAQIEAVDEERTEPHMALVDQGPPHAPSTDDGKSAQGAADAGAPGIHKIVFHNALPKEGQVTPSKEGQVTPATTKKKKKSATEFPFTISWGRGDSLASTESDAQHPEKSPLFNFSDQAATVLMRLIHLTHHGPSSLPIDKKSGKLDESEDHAYATLTMTNWHGSPDANEFTCAVMSHILTEMKYTAKGSDGNIDEYTNFDASWDTPLKDASLLTEFHTFFGDISVDPVALIKTLHANPDLETPLVRLLGCFVKQYCSTFFFDNGKPNGKTSVALAKRVSLPMCRAKNGKDPSRPGCNMLNVRYVCQCCNATCPKRIYMQGVSKVNDKATEAEWATYNKMKAAGPRKRSSRNPGPGDADDTPKEEENEPEKKKCRRHGK